MTSLRERVADVAHRIACPSRAPVPGDGCVGCGAPTADVYVTVGCAHCGAPGEPYCWTCVDTWPGDAEPITVAKLTVLPGRERGGD